jgi:hypothetical protein
MPQDSIRRYLKHGTLPQLRVFEASARLGNFSLAAQELHMAQRIPGTRPLPERQLFEGIRVVPIHLRWFNGFGA